MMKTLDRPESLKKAFQNFFLAIFQKKRIRDASGDRFYNCLKIANHYQISFAS